MNTISSKTLIELFQTAVVGQKISLVFNGSAYAISASYKILELSDGTLSPLQVVAKNPEGSAVTVIKTLLFSIEKIKACAEILAKSLARAESCEFPEVTVSLDEVDGNWILTACGGNSLFHMYFRSFSGESDYTEQGFGILIANITEKTKTSTKMECKGTQDALLLFAEHIEKLLNIKVDHIWFEKEAA